MWSENELRICVFIQSVLIEHLLDAYLLHGIRDTTVNKTGLSALWSIESQPMF